MDPGGIRMGSGEGSRMRNFLVCTVHLIMSGRLRRARQVARVQEGRSFLEENWMDPSFLIFWSAVVQTFFWYLQKERPLEMKNRILCDEIKNVSSRYRHLCELTLLMNSESEQNTCFQPSCAVIMTSLQWFHFVVLIK